MRKNFLLFLMIVVTLPAAALLVVSVHSYRAQEEAMDSMMRSYVLDLAETFAEIGRAGRGPSRHRPMGQMRFRMMSMDQALKMGEAGGMLYLAPDGRVLAASQGAEKLQFLMKDGPFDEEPRRAEDGEGNIYYAVSRELEDGNPSRGCLRTASWLLGNMKFWILPP